MPQKIANSLQKRLQLQLEESLVTIEQFCELSEMDPDLVDRVLGGQKEFRPDEIHEIEEGFAEFARIRASVDDPERLRAIGLTKLKLEQ